MKECRIIIIVVLLSIWLVSCVPRRKKDDTIKTFNKVTGDAMAVDSLIKKYEKEHQQFYRDEIQKGSYSEWPGLENKNLSKYCRKYLQHAVPGITNNSTIGNVIRILLYYGLEQIKKTSFVIVVHCKVMRKSCASSYYLTRAPELNCVYSLRHSKNKKPVRFNIIYKYCDFENKPIINKSLKRKRIEITSQVDIRTGQPVARDEYLLKYEMEHQEMLIREDKEGKYIQWQYAVAHTNLDSYCYQYMQECVPNRKREGVTGSWKIEKLNYPKLKSFEYVQVNIISCVPHNASKRQYHLTRAPKPNCVYALLQRIYNSQYSFVIIFKHCNFEDPTDELTASPDYVMPNENVITKIEMKEEKFDTLETLQFFPKD